MQSRPELQGTFGMVVSTHWLATAAGMAILELGGNAFDAAVASGLTLQVVEPHMCGPGGDMPAILWPADSSEAVVLCAQGPAPAAATIAHYRDELGLQLIPGTGPLAAVVPGAFGGWLTMLRDYGTLRLRDVMRFAIGYAENGYPVLPQLAKDIEAVAELFRDDWTPSAEVYLPVPAARGLHRNRKLAETYQRVIDDAEAVSSGREGEIDAALDIWYRGFVAEAIVGFQAREWLDSSGERHRGLLSEKDLREWRPTYESPLAVDYAGLTVLKAGPWTQGPVFLQQLRLLEGFDLQELGRGSVESIHVVTESAKLALADREAWYGDPAFVNVPIDDLLSISYADERRRLIEAEASELERPGAPGGLLPRLPAAVASPTEAAATGVGEPMRAGLEADTVHLDVVDRWGNMVSATPSGGWLWGAPVIPELGFCLGTRGQIFWLEEGLAGSLEPGKRPRTTLSPTMVLRHDRPYMAFGTPGGDQQDQWALNALLQHLHFEPDLQAAIEWPNHHTQALRSSFYPRQPKPRHLAVEDRVGEETISGLRARGHDVEVSAAWSLGRVTAVRRTEAGGLGAAADPRTTQSYAAGR